MVRYRKLGYVELNVTDLEKSVAFYRDTVGLEPAGKGPEGEQRFRCSEDPFAVALHQAPKPGFKRGGWMLEDASQFPVLHKRLEAAGVPYETFSATECEKRGFASGTRIMEPNTGAVMEFYLLPANVTPRAFAPTVAKIQRLGHVVWATPHKVEAVAFFRDVLNFAESDSIGENTTFFRAFPNPYHHGIGVAKGAQQRFNHLNFMVTEIDDVGRALARLKANNVPIVFGPGRHPASTSVFIYFLDPDGLTLEYSFGMEEFPEINPREARRLEPMPQNVDAWGSYRDPRFGATGEIEAHTIARATQ